MKMPHAPNASRLSAALVLAIALSSALVGAVVVFVIIRKSGFGTRFAPLGTDVLLYGIEGSLIAAACWAWLAWRWRRGVWWLCGACVAMAAVIFAAHYFGVVCTSKKARMCEPLFEFLDERPSIVPPKA